MNLIIDTTLILSDWKKIGSDALDDLREVGIAEDGLLYFTQDRESKTKTISKLRKIIKNICIDLNISNINYWKMANFSTIFLCDNMVLKFFSNRWSHSIDEYNMVTKFINKDIPGLVKYYKVWNSNCKTIRGNRPGPFYAILMERCDDLSESERMLFNKFHYILNLDKTSNKITKEEMLEKLNNFSQTELINEFVDLFFLLKGVVSLDDFRGDNLGRVGGKLIHFDSMDRRGFV
jgi:hypothetical protein